jgi:hypothetical protein
MKTVIHTEIIPGDPDSDLLSDLGYDVKITDFDPYQLVLDFNFANPYSISTGVKPDTIQISIVDTSWFLSRDTLLQIPPSRVLTKTIPR